ncbi:hypothetical protein ABT119_06165 [Streptomyces sp. NPDC001910]|uniref:hypothetical protein n=1 Tax=Streptomyces sp. NPDC001910 TaxID=3154403 RepID=UPI003322DA96
MTLVKLAVRKGSAPVEVDLDTLTPKARALAEAVHASPGHQPLGVLCDTGHTKGDNPNHAYVYGTGVEADEIGSQPDLRFMRNLEPLPRDAETSPEEWLEYNARQIPVDSWPIAGARSRMEPLAERVPSAAAARDDRCLTRDQALRYLADRGIVVSNDAWIMLQKAGNAPEPRHYALGGRMPLWHVDNLDAYAGREVEQWPVTRVAELLGFSGPSAAGSARKQLSRWGLSAVGRAPGRGGESLFAADQVQAAHAARPGSGRRGAPRVDGRFK